MADEKYRLENHTAADLDEMLNKVGELYTKDELDELIAAKADQSALDELVVEVGNKADQTGLEALEVEVNGKQDSLTFDSSPTEGSTNPVTSGGIYSAILRMAFGPGTLIPAAADNPITLTSYTNIGRFYIGATGAQYVTDRPQGLNYGFSLEVSTIFDNSRLRHKIYYNSPNAAGTYYERYLVSSGWTSWYKFAGEAVT